MGLFGKLIGSEQTAKAAGIPKLSRGSAERLKNLLGIAKLESIPATAARAFQLASDPKTKASDFVSIIEGDEVLSARVMKIANSVYFYRGSQATDIEKAVANIGVEELRCLLSTSMLRNLLQGSHPARAQVWANSIGTAIAAKHLAILTNSLADGEAFLCGLLHDVGKLIIIRRQGNNYQKVFTKVNAESISFVDAEDVVFELNHVDVGHWIGDSWNFPSSVMMAITNHHMGWDNFVAGRQGPFAPALITKVADLIAHSVGIGHGSGMKAFQERAREELPVGLQRLGLSAEQCAGFIADLPSQFEKQSALLET